MKIFKKAILFCLILLAIQVLESCANAQVSAGVGLNVNFGPHGPRVTPSLNVGVYDGGRF